MIGSPGITQKQHSSQTTQGMQKVHQNTPNYGIQKYFAKTKPSLSKAITKPLSSTGTPTAVGPWGDSKNGCKSQLQRNGTCSGCGAAPPQGCPGVGVALTHLPGVSPGHSRAGPPHGDMDGMATCPAVGAEQEQGRGTTHRTALSPFLAPIRKEEFPAMKIGMSPSPQG